MRAVASVTAMVRPAEWYWKHKRPKSPRPPLQDHRADDARIAQPRDAARASDSTARRTAEHDGNEGSDSKRNACTARQAECEPGQ